jgi:hypothetical protein
MTLNSACLVRWRLVSQRKGISGTGLQEVIEDDLPHPTFLPTKVSLVQPFNFRFARHLMRVLSRGLVRKNSVTSGGAS